MRLIKSDSNINFIAKRKIAFFLSVALIVVSMVSLVIHKGPNYGIDFAGGTLIQVKFMTKTSMDDIKSGLATIGLGKSTVQVFGDPKENEYLIRADALDTATEGLSLKVEKAVKLSTGNDADIRRVEMVGPKVGSDLREKALFSMFYALLFIAIYISGRFEMKWLASGVMTAALIFALLFVRKICIFFNLENSIPVLICVALIVTLVFFWFLKLKYAMGAIVAIIHDVIITVGIFSLLELDFTLSIIAALLTIIGYSLNDTIIVFDRIRENLHRYRNNPLEKNINKSINETLNRTILTSFTTLMVVGSLFLIGGSIIHDFAFAMIIGIFVGTYSSIFVASPILLVWDLFEKRV